jgi:hypothetical protein
MTLGIVKRLPLLLIAACSSAEETFVVPEPPPVGFQIHLRPVTIGPGEDIEFCTYFNLDTADMLAAEGKPFLLEDLVVNQIDPLAGEIAVNRIDVRGAPGLHHIQILAIENDLEDVEDKHIFECAVDLFGGPLTGDVDPLFFTSRSDLAVAYPEGAARVLKRVPDLADDTKTRGAQLLYNFHYLNPTLEPIQAEVVVNLHVVPRETIAHPVRSAWWNYVYFDVEPGKTSTAAGHGSFLVDVNLVGMTSHQHETGSAFTFELGGEEIYRAEDWGEPEYLTFDEPRFLAKGEEVDFACEWNNTFGANRYFGLQADDEMCTAIIEYYPDDEAEAEALLEMQRQEQMMSMEPSFEGSAVTLESFLGFPDELLEQIITDPDHAFDYLDKDIICGIALNLKQMERQYGRSPETLESLQALVDFLAPICRL